MPRLRPGSTGTLVKVPMTPLMESRIPAVPLDRAMPQAHVVRRVWKSRHPIASGAADSNQREYAELTTR